MSNLIGAGEGLLVLGVIGEPDAQGLENLSRCQRDWRLTSDIAVASATLIFYDWFLTSGDELAFLWKWDRSAYVRMLFFLARYPALVSAIMGLLPPAVTRTNIATCLRVLTIICSELILATRTWVIWGKSRKMLGFLVIFSIACLAPGLVIVGRDIATTSATDVVPSATWSDMRACRVLTSAVKYAWVVPYIVVIVFEAVVLSLTLYRVLQFRGSLRTQRSKLFALLWIDGVIYFVLMLVLGFLNVALVLQVSNPQLRSGGTQLQTVFHSILSTRIVLHITTVLRQDLVGSRSTTLVQHRDSTRMELADSCDT